MNSLQDKVCMVAGAGKGVGRAAAHLFARAGAKVVIVARQRTVLDETRSLVEKTGFGITALAADLSIDSEAERVVAETVDRMGRIDGLYCCAGTFVGADLDETTDDTVEALFHSNFLAQYHAAKAAARRMKERKSGAIVLTSAVFGTAFSARRLSAYAASKAANLSSGLSMAADLRDHNVRVNVLCPGTITHHYQSERDPTARTLGNGPAWPEDVARAAAFLLSDEAFWITGSTLNVDGGFSIARNV